MDGSAYDTPQPGELPDVLEPWSGNERINLLLLGLDERQDQDGPWRTDTMIVLTATISDQFDTGSPRAYHPRSA